MKFRWFTWCEQLAVACVGILGIGVGKPFLTLAYMQAHGVLLLQIAGTVWFCARFVDFICYGPKIREFLRFQRMAEKQKKINR